MPAGSSDSALRRVPVRAPAAPSSPSRPRPPPPFTLPRRKLLLPLGRTQDGGLSPLRPNRTLHSLAQGVPTECDVSCVSRTLWAAATRPGALTGPGPQECLRSGFSAGALWRGWGFRVFGDVYEIQWFSPHSGPGSGLCRSPSVPVRPSWHRRRERRGPLCGSQWSITGLLCQGWEVLGKIPQEWGFSQVMPGTPSLAR